MLPYSRQPALAVACAGLGAGRLTFGPAQPAAAICGPMRQLMKATWSQVAAYPGLRVENWMNSH